MGARAVSALAAADSLVLVLEATVCVRQCVLASLPAVRFLSVVFSPRSILCVSCRRRRRRRPVSLCPSALSFVAAPPSGQECVVLAACSYRWEAGVPGPQVAIPARHPGPQAPCKEVRPVAGWVLERRSSPNNRNVVRVAPKSRAAPNKPQNSRTLPIAPSNAYRSSVSTVRYHRWTRCNKTHTHAPVHTLTCIEHC